MSQTEKKMLPLCKHVSETLEAYLLHLGNHKATNLYQMVLEEIEHPLFKTIMKHVNDNQSEAANILGISRGTLRKKLKQYKLD